MESCVKCLLFAGKYGRFTMLCIVCLRVGERPLSIVCWRLFAEERTGPLSKREEYEQKTERFLLPIVESMGFELVDVEYVKEGKEFFLRAYIDKPGGITIDDCVAVSRQMNEILDREDYIPDAYTFEVSSPGLGRPLKKDKDFERSLGEEVEIRLYRAVDSQKEYAGVLKAYDKDTVTIVTEDDTERTFQRSDISLIRLAFDF